MKKTTKGAFAAGTAAVLLTGGAGTMAYWSATGNVDGGTIAAGNLALSTPNCGAGWTYDGGEITAGAPFTPGTSLLVPGDVITKTCTTTLTATGDHMRGTIAASTPASLAPFTVTVGNITGASPAFGAGNTFTEANDGDVLSIEIKVTLPSTDTASQSVSKSLDAITLTASQIHS